MFLLLEVSHLIDCEINYIEILENLTNNKESETIIIEIENTKKPIFPKTSTILCLCVSVLFMVKISKHTLSLHFFAIILFIKENFLIN
jgi:hypothetical protein